MRLELYQVTPAMGGLGQGHSQFSFYNIHTLWLSHSTGKKLPSGHNQVLFKAVVGLQKLRLLDKHAVVLLTSLEEAGHERKAQSTL